MEISQLISKRKQAAKTENLSSQVLKNAVERPPFFSAENARGGNDFRFSLYIDIFRDW